MHLIALVCADGRLSQALSRFRDDQLDIYLHPVVVKGELGGLAASLEPLDFAGALVLDPALQPHAAQVATRSSLDAQEAGAADTLTVAPGGLIAEYNLGRAVGAALRDADWHAHEASAVILGASPLTRAVSRELASLGVRQITVVGKNQPLAEAATAQPAAGTEIIARAEGDPLTATLIERADLLVRLDASMRVGEAALGPHLTVVDLAPNPLSPLRQQAMATGALTLGLRDIQTQQLTLALSHILGGRLEPSRFADILHAL